jgi:tRNA wybutosine-synthesizing protein 2
MKRIRFHFIGDIALVKFFGEISKKEKISFANSLKSRFPRIKTIAEILSIEGEFREPRINILLGKETETIHKEHGILYKLDVSKVMFSKGNLYERNRIAKKVEKNEIVVDMFAGIGYFSLGIAKYSKPKLIYAIEKNPVAFNFLKENIVLNKINNIIPILGDCRDVAKSLEGIADRVIMGYIKNTEKFLPTALLFLSKDGKKIIHFHNTYKKEELWDKPIKTIEKYTKENGYSVEILEKRIIKSYAPKIFHVVIDFKLSNR